jgi:hypothetical protein
VDVELVVLVVLVLLVVQLVLVLVLVLVVLELVLSFVSFAVSDAYPVEVLSLCTDVVVNLGPSGHPGNGWFSSGSPLQPSSDVTLTNDMATTRDLRLLTADSLTGPLAELGLVLVTAVPGSVVPMVPLVVAPVPVVPVVPVVPSVPWLLVACVVS